MKEYLVPSKMADTSWDLVRNALVEGSDREALRFSAYCADRLVANLRPAPGDKILDVLTGTGAVALAASQAVGPTGRVIAIDTAERLLARLDDKIQKFGISNIDVHTMDAQSLDFRRDYFGHTVCSLGLLWLSDPRKALREWLRVTRPGGSVNVAVFAPKVFQPQLGLLQQRIFQFSGSRELTLPWDQLSQRESLLAVLQEAGLVDVTVQEVQLGYHLRDAQEWWELVWYSALRMLVEQVPAAQRDRFRLEHISEVTALVNADGLWVTVPVLLARGFKPT